MLFVEEMEHRNSYWRFQQHHKAPVGKVFEFWLSRQLGFKRNVDLTVRQELKEMVDILG